MKKLFIIWGIAVLFIFIFSPLSVSAAKQPDARHTAIKKTARHKAARPATKKVETAPVVFHKKTPAVKKAPFGRTRVIYINHKTPWYWNSFALLFMGSGIFLVGLIIGRVWKMGPIPRPPAEFFQEEIGGEAEPKENWLKRFFGIFRKAETSHQPA